MICFQDVFNIMLIIVGIPALAYEMVYSDAGYFVKRLLKLDKEYPIIKGLASPKLFSKILPVLLYYLFLPVICLVLVLMNAHQVLRKILSCTYCTSFHVGWLISLIIGMPVLVSILIGSCCLFSAGVYNLIRKHAAL